MDGYDWVEDGMNPIETIVFDLDGTLVDSVRDVGAILQQMRQERGLCETDDSDIRYWSSRGGHEMIRAILGCADEEADFLLDDFRTRYAERPTDPASLYAGVDSVLSTLSSRGFSIALCTNKPQRLTEKVLSELSIRDYFHSVVCGDTLARKKPDPQPLTEAIRRAGGRAESTLMIGDSTVDLRTAQAVGVRFAFFSGGYDDGVRREDACCILSDITDVFAFVIGET